MILNLFKITLPSKRIFGLDLLRAFAIILVLMSHSNELLPNFIGNFLHKYFLIDGVGIFFVLSGFLIGGILITDFEKEISLKSLFHFWKRRWYRTLPNYFLILVILTIIYFSQLELLNWLKYIPFLQNFSYPISSFFPESWSLSIEEWFYLITPFLIIILSKYSHLSLKTIIIVVAISLILFSTGLRFYRYFTLNYEKGFRYWDLYYNRQVITRLDSMMYGILGAWIKKYHNKVFLYRKKILLWGGVILLFGIHFYFNFVHNYTTYIISFSLNSIATLMTIPFLSTLIIKKHNHITKLFTLISIISYSLYLVNLSIVSLYILPIVKCYIKNDVINFILFWLISILMSIVIYKYYENPIMKFRDKKRRIN